MCPFEAKNTAVVWMDCFISDFRKARRKDKEPSTPCPDDPKLYLEEAVLERKLPDIDLRVLVDLPAGLDYNEWLASHSKNAFSVLLNSSFRIWSESAETEFIYIRWIARYRDVAVAHVQPCLRLTPSLQSGLVLSTRQTYNVKNSEPGVIKSANLSGNMKT